MTKEEIIELLKPIKVAKVLSIEKHPNADRLILVQVALQGGFDSKLDSGIGSPGNNEQRQVITAATNINEGDLVPFLDQGNIVPGYKIMDCEEIMLSTRNMRGIESTCMILAADEIGLSKDHEGIWIIEETRMKEKNLGISILEVLTDDEIDTIVNNQKNN